MTKWLRVIGVAAVLLAVCPLAARAPQSPAATAERMVRDLMERSGTPGSQVAIAVDGTLVWSQPFGVADVEQRTPVSQATRFRIGSVSKAFTAAALARLIDEGRIDLDAPVRRYVPAVPSGVMTVRQVAGHLSGIRNYRGAEFLSREAFGSVAAALDVFLKDPLLSEPGSTFAYSSYNYTLLSAAIESAAGQPFMEYLKSAVVEPLQLRSTVFDVPNAIIADRARWYEKSNGIIGNAPFVDVSNKWAAGGLLSTADDMVRFALGLTSPRYLSLAARQVLVTPQRTTAGDPVAYGIGWRTDPGGSNQVWHGGEAMGARAFLFMDPTTRSVVAFTSNLGGTPFTEKDARDLLTLFAGPPRSR